MKFVFQGFALALVPCFLQAKDPQVISSAKQLTFEGLRAGEGYFSQDGKKMVFQSERHPGNPFYQIYIMDLLSGKTEKVSPGHGKTTCAWIHPSGDKVLFASTHLDKDLKAKVKAEYEERKSPQKGKYSWSYDDQFSLFEYDLKTKRYKRLTFDRGYNAEGSYSPDGKLIAFSSNRLAYKEKLSQEEQKRFEQDAAYMADLYVMNADGSGLKQITQTRGYDGGPFFSPDGKRLTFRRFSADGRTAEVYTIGIDGKDEKQITRLNAMSWAPYYHPSGDYLIFTTNLLGYSNFELFIVDVEGKKEPVRISYVDGFDGLPVFSPDGHKISWTHKNEKGESQIYLADWDDLKARQLLGLRPRAPKLSALSPAFDVGEMQRLLSYFASPELAGRKTGSPEEDQYTQVIAEMFSSLGLKPALAKSFSQSFEFTSGVELAGKQELLVRLQDETITAKLANQFMPLSFSKSGRVSGSGLVFAGYGITAPATDKIAIYDSYAGLDVKGKWVLVLRDIPEDLPLDRKVHLNRYSRLQHKALVAKQQGALGLLIASGPKSSSRQKVLQLKFDGALSGSDIPVISISNDLAEKLVKSNGKSLSELQTLLNKGDLLHFQVADLGIQSEVNLKAIRSRGKNVIAKLSVPGAKRSLVIGAHGDHLGLGELGSSLAKGEEQGQAHLGADDNASGMVGVLQLAKYLNDPKVRKNLKQNIIFAVWSGEEIGNIGSSHFLKENKEPISAYLNMDMIGRYKDQVLVQGTASAKEWKSLIEEWSLANELSITAQEDPYLPTDSMAFYLKEIPTLSFFTGAHAEYHTPRDRVELINFPGLQKVLQLIKDAGLRLASSDRSIVTYQKVESAKASMPGRSFRIFLGTIPDYSQEGVKGVRISGTSKDSPAEKAGLKSGDVIVELGKVKIENLYDYVYVLQALKPEQQVPIKLLRESKLVESQIVPKLKE